MKKYEKLNNILLYGDETDVFKFTKIFFKKEHKTNLNYEKNYNLIVYSFLTLKLCSKIENKEYTLEDLYILIMNFNGKGRMFINKFLKLQLNNEKELNERDQIASYFLDIYFNEKREIYDKTELSRLLIFKYILKKNQKQNKVPLITEDKKGNLMNLLMEKKDDLI